MTIALGQVLTNLTPEMKAIYLPGLVNTVEYKQIIKNRIKPGNRYDASYEYKLPYQVALSEGGGMIAYNGALPTPGSSEYANLTGTVKHRSVSMLVYGSGKSYTNTNEKAYIDAVANEIKAKADAEALEQERIWFGKAGQGIGQFTAPGASHSGGVVTITLDTAYTGKNATKYIRRGMLVSLYDGAVALTNGVGLKVKSKTRTTFLVAGDAQLATDINTAGTAGDGFVFLPGAVATPEYYGLWDLIGSATNTVHDINRATAGNEWYQPLVYYQGASGPVLGEKQTTNYDWEPLHLKQILDELFDINGADKNDLLLFCESDVENFMIEQQRNNGEQVMRSNTVDNWPYEVVKFNGVPVIATPFCWPNVIFGANTRSFMQLDNQKLDWTPMGTGFWKQHQDANGIYDAYAAYAVERGEHSIKEPMKNFTLWNVKGASD